MVKVNYYFLVELTKAACLNNYTSYIPAPLEDAGFSWNEKIISRVTFLFKDATRM